MDMATNKNATTNVDLKTSFSSPRLVKLAPPPKPADLPKPVPLA